GVYHNSVAVLAPDGTIAGLYRKMHIPDDPLFYEKFYFTPGDLGFRAFDTPLGRVGTLVCWDQWYPEAARLTALAGADVLLYPTAIGWHPREKAEFGEAQVSAWQTMQRAHAIANGVYVAAVNRVGHEGPADGGLEFWGTSFVCDPFGVILRQASRTDEEILTVECDRRHLEDGRGTWPFLRARRIAASGRIPGRLLDGCRRRRRRRRSATACRRSGSRTPRPGSRGPTSGPTGRESSRRSRGCSPTWCAISSRASGSASSSTTRRARRARVARSRAHTSTWAGSTSSASRPTAAGRATTGRSSCGATTAPSQSPTGDSPAGRSIRTGTGTMRCPRGSPGDSDSSGGSSTWSLRAGRSTGTAGARCSRPRSACSRPSRPGTRGSVARASRM